MNSKRAIDGERALSSLNAFDAMRAFLEAYWEREFKQSDDIAVLLGSLNRVPVSDTPPLDIALGHEWLKAIQKSQHK
jgi:hypothetical protein